MRVQEESFRENKSPVYLDDFVVDERCHIWRNDDLSLRAVAVPAVELTRMMIVLGKMGSGKSIFLYNLLLQDQAYERAIVHDIKGEYVEIFYRDGLDVILNPYDERGFFWDLWSDLVRFPTLVAKVAKTLAFAVSGSGTDEFWAQASATQLRKAFRRAIEEKKKGESGWAAVRRYIREYRKQAIEEDNRTALSVAENLQPLSDLFDLLEWLEVAYPERAFSIENFLSAREKQKLFLVTNPMYQDSLIPYYSAFLSCLIAALLSRPDTKSDLTMMLLDEFLTFRLPKDDATALFTIARSKGVQLIVGSQFLPTDQQNGWKTQLMLSSRYALILFPIADESTLRLLQNIVGEQEWIFTSASTGSSASKSHTWSKHHSFSESISQSFNVSTSYQRTPFLTPALLSYIPRFHHLTFIGPHVYLGYTPDWKLKKSNPPFIDRDLERFYEWLEIREEIALAEEKLLSSLSDILDQEQKKEEGDLNVKAR